MEIAFANRRVAKTFNTIAELNKTYGRRMAKVITMRMDLLKAANNLSLVPAQKPARRHQLKGDRDEQFAVDLVHPQRLVFIPDHDPIPRREDGGIDLAAVTAIEIIEIVDYH